MSRQAAGATSTLTLLLPTVCFTVRAIAYLRPVSYTHLLVVTFHNGDDTYTQNIYGGKGTLKANTFASADKVFAGWATVSGGEIVYADGAKIELTESIDLYAVWGDAYKVTFYNNGTETSVLVAQHTAIGSSRLPADPTRKGYIFGGWFSGDEKPVSYTHLHG